jgi:hypothetical protein
MPLAAPVTMATLSLRRMAVVLSLHNVGDAHAR